MPANPPRKSPNYWRIWKNEFGCNPPWYRPVIFMELMLNTHLRFITVRLRLFLLTLNRLNIVTLIVLSRYGVSDLSECESSVNDL